MKIPQIVCLVVIHLIIGGFLDRAHLLEIPILYEEYSSLSSISSHNCIFKRQEEKVGRDNSRIEIGQSLPFSLQSMGKFQVH